MLNKKKLCCVTALCLTAALLAACGGQPQVSISAAGSSPSSEAAPISELTLCTAASSQGYYTFENMGDYGDLTYFDYASSKQMVLCGRPECTHDNESCPAYICTGIERSTTAIKVVNDCMLVEQIRNDAGEIEVVASDLNRENRRTVATMPASYVTWEPVFSCGSTLYLLADDIDMDTAAETKRIIRIDLDAGTAESVYDYPENDYTPMLVSAYKNKLLLTSAARQPDGSYKEEWAYFNVDTRQMEEPFAALTEAEGFVAAEGSWLYTVDRINNNAHFEDLHTGEKYTLDFADLFAQDPNMKGDTGMKVLFGDYAMLSMRAPEAGSGEYREYAYLFNIRTGESEAFTLTDNYRGNLIYPRAQDGDRLLVVADYRQSDAIDSTGEPCYRYQTVYAFISVDDYIHSRPNFDYIDPLDA